MQSHPAPTCGKHPEGGPITCGWKVAYAALVAALPRPIRVYRDRPGRWIVYCRLCGVATDLTPTHAEALESALWELHEGHGCPNRRTTGEPCDTTCIHCHGWQWCAQPSEKREL